MAVVLADASALIALLDRSDASHRRCVAALSEIRDPIVTVWPALTEAMHMLSRVRGGPETLARMVEDDALELVDLGRDDIQPMRELMAKYADLPMDFADAALVRVAARDGITRILTLDRHFEVYRLPKRRRFVVLTA